jgi:hypothetical protein
MQVIVERGSSTNVIVGVGERFNLFSYSIGSVPVVIIPNYVNFSRGIFHANIHELPMTESLAGQPDISYAGVSGKQVLDGVGAVVNDNPLYIRVCLRLET